MVPQYCMQSEVVKIIPLLWFKRYVREYTLFNLRLWVPGVYTIDFLLCTYRSEAKSSFSSMKYVFRWNQCERRQIKNEKMKNDHNKENMKKCKRRIFNKKKTFKTIFMRRKRYLKKASYSTILSFFIDLSLEK